jgi:hypothetical protein
MRCAIISDVHGNLDALEAVLADAGEVDQLWCLGDIVGPGRDNAALVALHLVGSRRGRRIDMDGHHMIRLNDEGLVIEGWGFVEDQAALDEFFSA